MKCALGVVSNEKDLITKPEDLNGKTLIVSKGTTAETYFTENYPKVNLLKFDQYSEAYNALLDGRGVGLSTDNTEVLAWAIENPGFSVGIESLGSLDTIAPAVTKGNESLLNWINDEIKALAGEKFFQRQQRRFRYGCAAEMEDVGRLQDRVVGEISDARVAVYPDDVACVEYNVGDQKGATSVCGVEETSFAGDFRDETCQAEGDRAGVVFVGKRTHLRNSCNRFCGKGHAQPARKRGELH